MIADPSGRRIDADRVISLPVLVGRTLAGVGSDERGLIRIDAHGRVARAAGVYAAGNGANFAIKQGAGHIEIDLPLDAHATAAS